MSASKIVLVLTLLVAYATAINHLTAYDGKCISCLQRGNYYCWLEDTCYDAPQDSSSTCTMNTTNMFMCNFAGIDFEIVTLDKTYSGVFANYSVTNYSSTSLSLINGNQG